MHCETRLVVVQKTYHIQASACKSTEDGGVGLNSERVQFR